MKVESLWMRRTGTYNPMYSRPYQMGALSSSDVRTVGMLQEATMNGTALDHNSLTHVANSILTPSAQAVSHINVAGGLDQAKFYFFLTVVVSVSNHVKKLVLLSGHTDYDGITPSGAFDPNMRLYFNNHIQLREMRTVTGRGVGTQLAVAGTNQIITNGIATSQPSNLVTMRPADVLSDAAFAQTNVKPHGGDLFDARFTWNTALKFNARENNSSAMYLSKFLSAQASAENQSSYTYSGGNLYSAARGMVNEFNPHTDPLISEFARYTEILQRGYVTWAELLSMPGNENLDSDNQRCVISFPSPNEYVHRTGDTEAWHGADSETQIAYLLANAVPALMMKNLLVDFQFTATNNTRGGGVITAPGMFQGVRGVDVTTSIPSVIQEFESNIFNLISNQGQSCVDLMVKCDIFGEIKIDLSYNNGPVIRWTMPTFCDGNSAPTISVGTEAISSLSSGLVNVLDIARGSYHEGMAELSNPFDSLVGQTLEPMSPPAHMGGYAPLPVNNPPPVAPQPQARPSNHPGMIIPDTIY